MNSLEAFVILRKTEPRKGFRNYRKDMVEYASNWVMEHRVRYFFFCLKLSIIKLFKRK